MSGPKLSAYELEQLRKAELERIHREIIRIKTLAMAEIQRVQSEIQRCQEELSRLNYQRKLVEASSLSAADKDSVNHEIQFQMDQVLSLEREYSAIHPEPFGTTLEEVQRVYSLLSEQIADCTHSRQAIESSRGTYEALLSKVAENLCEQVSTESYSLDEALANLPPRVITGEALQDQKNALVQRVYAITNNPLANPDTKARVQKALRRINETNNQRELEEIGSMVVGEIERNLKQIEPLMGEYLQLMCRKNALATSLGLPEENPMQGINNVAELRQLIHSTKMQVEKMQAQHLELAEREEIARSIDAAMEELGYEFIGVKQSENSTSRIKLFEFSEGTGLQIIHR